MFGSFQISQTIFRPEKCFAAAPAHRAKAATLSGCCGAMGDLSSLPVRGCLNVINSS
jgi:hypothetical protein